MVRLLLLLLFNDVNSRSKIKSVELAVKKKLFVVHNNMLGAEC